MVETQHVHVVDPGLMSLVVLPTKLFPQREESHAWLGRVKDVTRSFMV